MVNTTLRNNTRELTETDAQVMGNLSEDKTQFRYILRQGRDNS